MPVPVLPACTLAKVRAVLCATLMAAALAVLAPASQAATQAQMRAEARAGSLTKLPVLVNETSEAGDPLRAEARNAASSGSNQGRGHAGGTVALGWMTVQVDADAAASDNPDFSGVGTGRGLASVSWSDRLTVTSATHSGAGFLLASVQLVAFGPLDAQAALTGLANAEFSAGASLVTFRSPTQPEEVFRAGTWGRSGLNPAGGSAINDVVVDTILGEWTVLIPFEFNLPFELVASLGSQAVVGAQFGETATAAAGLQMIWAGIPYATLTGGPSGRAWAEAAITDFSVIGASGTDWRLAATAPVPEPASAALLLAGLGLVGAWRYRRMEAAG